MMRRDERKFDELRDIKITPNFLLNGGGSALIEFGNTKVICSAMIENGVPVFLRGTGNGWLTAEYAMLPSATDTRSMRESSKGKVGGRTHEIQRLIGRSLRAVTDLKGYGEKTIYIDCDVICADGGTRTASITGAFIALSLLFDKLLNRGDISISPIKDYIGAISVGVVDGMVLLDLNYEEDSHAEVDANIVITGKGEFIEIQSTAEGAPFSQAVFLEMLSVATMGIRQIIDKQKKLLDNITEKVANSKKVF